MATTEELEAKLAADDKVWKGPRLHALLGVSVVVILAVLYFIACVRSGDYTWNFLAHEPAHEVMPSGW